MGETLLKFRNKTNGPLPIDLPGGNSISVAAKGYFTCTPEDAECPDVRREKSAGRIRLVKEKAAGKPVHWEDKGKPSAVSPKVESLVKKGRDEKAPPLVFDGGPPSNDPPRKEGRPEDAPPLIMDGDKPGDGGDIEKSGDSLTSSSEMMESGEAPEGDESANEPSGGKKKKKKSSKRKKS